MAIQFAPVTFPCAGRTDTACLGTYEDDIDNLRYGLEMTNMRLAADADLTILLRARGDGGCAGCVGQAHLTRLGDRNDALKAQGVAKFELAGITGDLRKNDNIDHEIGHLLGAHHSAYNLSEPGTSPNVAYLWTHVDKSSQPFHSNRTIMSYYDTCTNRWPPYTCWPEDNWSSPHPVSHWGQEPPTPVGTQTENNVSHISWLLQKLRDLMIWLNQTQPLFL